MEKYRQEKERFDEICRYARSLNDCQIKRDLTDMCYGWKAGTKRKIPIFKPEPHKNFLKPNENP